MDTELPGKRLEDFRAEQVIFREGERADCMYLIRAGTVEILKNLGGKHQRINLLGPGDFFGEMALLLSDARTATARAYVDSQLLRIQKQDFERLMALDVEVPLRIMRRLAFRLHSTEDRLEEVMPRAQGQAAGSDPTLAELRLEGGEGLWTIRKKATVIGRKDPVTDIEPGVELSGVEQGMTVSHYHARLLLEAEGFFLVEEVGAKNGTRVNGEKLAAGVARLLQDGDELRVGRVRLRFRDLRAGAAS